MNADLPTGEHMWLAGYVPLSDHGFALPLYLAKEHGNAWHVAIAAAEGDHLGPIARFEWFDSQITHRLERGLEVWVGDPWQDIFLWNDRPVIGTPHAIFKKLARCHDELRRIAPLSFLDLALAARSTEAHVAADGALAFLKDKLGEERGSACFRETVIRPGVLLELHRHWLHRVSRDNLDSVLPDTLRNFIVRPLGATGYSVELAPDSLTLLGSREACARLAEAVAGFGEAVGTSLQVSEREVGRPGDTAEAHMQNSEPEGDGHDEVVDEDMRLAESKDPLSAAREEPEADIAAELQATSLGEKKPARPFWSRLFGEIREIAIDLGTANTRIFIRDQGIVLAEPSVIGIETINGVRRVKAVGNDAKLMMAKSPDSIELIHPLHNGAITDVDYAEAMLKSFISKVLGKRTFQQRFEVIICTSTDTTQVERRAIGDAASNAGARRVRLIEEPMAAAIGADMPVTASVGSMVVNIGSGKAEVALLSVRGLAHTTSVRGGGNDMDNAIAAYVRRNHNLLIGQAVAERIKKQVGVAKAPAGGAEGETVHLRGRDLVSGDPREITINQRQIAEALSEPVGNIVEAVRLTLDNAVPELAVDIVDQGIVLTGGGALLTGLDEVLHDETGVPVIVADDPLTCVARGIGEVLANPMFRTVLFSAWA